MNSCRSALLCCHYKFNRRISGFVDGRSETSSDSEEIEYDATKLQMRNFPSVEQIQDSKFDQLSCHQKSVQIIICNKFLIFYKKIKHLTMFLLLL